MFPFYVSYHHLLFFLAYKNSLFLLAYYNSLQSAFVLQAKKAIDVEVYCQQIIVKATCIDNSTKFSTKVFATSLAMLFSNRIYQLGSCGYWAVIHQSDGADVKNDVTADGTKWTFSYCLRFFIADFL